MSEQEITTKVAGARQPRDRHLVRLTFSSKPGPWTAAAWRDHLKVRAEESISTADLADLEELPSTLWRLLEEWEGGFYHPNSVETLRVVRKKAGTALEKVQSSLRRADAFLGEIALRGEDCPPLDEAARIALAEEAKRAYLFEERKRSEAAAAAGPWTAATWRAALKPIRDRCEDTSDAAEMVDNMVVTADWLVTGWEEGDYREKHMDELRAQLAAAEGALLLMQAQTERVRGFLAEVDRRGAAAPAPDEAATMARTMVQAAEEERKAAKAEATKVKAAKAEAARANWTRESWLDALESLTNHAEPLGEHIDALVDLKLEIATAQVIWQTGGWSDDHAGKLERVAARASEALHHLTKAGGCAILFARKLKLGGPAPAPERKD